MPMAEASGWTQLLVAYVSVGAFALPFVHKLKVLKFIQFKNPDLIIWPTAAATVLIFAWIMNDFAGVYFEQLWWIALVAAFVLFTTLILLAAQHAESKNKWVLAIGIALNILMLTSLATSGIVAFSQFVFFRRIEVTLVNVTDPSKYFITMRDEENKERVNEAFGSRLSVVVFLTEKRFESIATVRAAGRFLTLNACKDSLKRTCLIKVYPPE